MFLLQISSRTIADIDQRVRRISGIARKYYSQSELEPLDILEQKTEETIRLMSDLSTSMRCEPIHMYVFQYWLTNLIFQTFCANAKRKAVQLMFGANKISVDR